MTVIAPRTHHRPVPAPKRLLALLALVALTAVSCARSAEVVEASRSAPESASEFAASEAAVAPEPAPASAPESVAPAPALAPVDTASSGHQYGASIDEWSAATAEATGGDPDASPESAALADGYYTIDWDDLVEPGFTTDEIFARYEQQLNAIEPGSPEANALYEEIRAEFDGGARINAELDGAQIQLAGFVTPLSFTDDVISEFLLVPTFGACIHVPPPPPNQTVLVTLTEGINIDDTWGPVWVTGTLAIDTTETDLALASYTLTQGASRPYET